MSLETDMRAFLIEDADIAELCKRRVFNGLSEQDGSDSEFAGYPYIVFVRSNTEYDDCLGAEDEGDKPLHVRFDLEVWADDEQVRSRLGQLVAKKLHRHGIGNTGQFGTSNVQVINVQNQDDDYVPHGNMSDEHWTSSNFAVQVTPRY